MTVVAVVFCMFVGKRSCIESTRKFSSVSNFVIDLPNKPSPNEVTKLFKFISNSQHLVALTGAGISTASGIPDYRGPYGSYHRGHKPMNHSDFVRNENSRKRYWARSMMGWKTFSVAKPNDAHYSLSRLESNGILKHIITQNVDGLHQMAGSSKVSDLHGRIDRVRCLSCETTTSRRIIQQSLEGLNPRFFDFIKSRATEQEMRADGDMDLGELDYNQFEVSSCSKCGGILKPDVVMFGDNVPAKKVADIYEQIDQCDGLMVIGTSLEVYSAFRFIDRANKNGVPLAVLNFGPTRAERQGLDISFKSETNCAVLLKSLLESHYFLPY